MRLLYEVSLILLGILAMAGIVLVFGSEWL